MTTHLEPDAHFDHRGPGTPASAWRRADEWASAAPLDLDGVDRLVVLTAHPDDESLGVGGLLADAVEQGREVLVVCATDGEGSHPDSPTTTPEALAKLRRDELLEATARLGVAPAAVHLLGLPDGDLVHHERAIATAGVELVGDGRRTVVLSTWRHDGHPDHEAVGRAAAAVARRTGADLWEFPVWFWHWGHPDKAPWPRLHPYAVPPAAATAKAEAIAAHRTQVAPLSHLQGDEVLLGPDLLAHFAGGPEHVLVTPSVEAPDDALDDVHRDDPDPWGVETRWYEARKRALVLALLPRPAFRHALEVGCSTGALAASLATRAERVLALDRSPTALAAARKRFADTPQVTVADLDLPQEWPDSAYDLVVVSETGYFLSPVALEALVDRVAGSLEPGGVVVLCHWRHQVEGWVLDAEGVHRRFDEGLGLPRQATYRDRDVEIAVYAEDSGWPDPTR